MERREFIKTTCSLCLAIGAGMAITSLDSCASSNVYKTVVSENKIKVPISLFTNTDFQIIRSEDLEFDIALRKETNGDKFTSMLMRCTHADNQLSWTGKGYYCNLHGSKFDNEGKVIKGPAEESMKKLFTEAVGEFVIITLR